MSQYQLFRREQRRLSAYLDRITHSTSHSTNQSSNHSLGTSVNNSTRQSSNHSASQAPKRSLAPFEMAMLDESTGGQCSSAFHQSINEYRQWHAYQLARLNAVKHDISAVRRLLTDDREPIRIIVSQVNMASGLTDRMVGLMSFFTMAVLTKRVLFVDNDWPDVYSFMQTSIQLDLMTAAPFLKHPDLANLTLYQSWIDQQTTMGGNIDDIDKFFTHPISYRACNRGHQIRLLTENPRYSSALSDLFLTSDTIVACIYHSFWVIRASVFESQHAYDEPTATLLDPNYHSVGIQIRTGMSDYNKSAQSTDASLDGVNKLLEGGYQGFVHCAHDISDTMLMYKPHVKPLWFLVTDDLMLRSFALSRWSSGSPKLVTLMLPNSLGHSGLGDASHRLMFLQMALAEHTLFSFCAEHIISSNSGFGRLPAAAALREKPIFVVPIADLVADAVSLVPEAERMSCISHAKQGLSLEAVSQIGSRL